MREFGDAALELAEGRLIRVPPATRRQLLNRGDIPCVLLAIGRAGEHVGRDGEAFGDWVGDGRTAAAGGAASAFSAPQMPSPYEPEGPQGLGESNLARRDAPVKPFGYTARR